MGTRSLTFVYDTYDNKNYKIINMYRQYDGYPSGHGAELSEFLQDRIIVNGIGGGETRKISNGMGCLSASLVANFKDEAGGFYLYPVTMTDCGQDYEYHIYNNRVKVVEMHWSPEKKKSIGKTIFNGDWNAFKVFVDNAE